MENCNILGDLKKTWPEKFASEDEIFSHIHAGDKIFISTGCGEPQYLVQALVNFVSGNPKAFFGIEIIHVWILGAAPYMEVGEGTEEDQDGERSNEATSLRLERPHNIIKYLEGMPGQLKEREGT